MGIEILEGSVEEVLSNEFDIVCNRKLLNKVYATATEPWHMFGRKVLSEKAMSLTNRLYDNLEDKVMSLYRENIDLEQEVKTLKHELEILKRKIK